MSTPDIILLTHVAIFLYALWLSVYRLPTLDRRIADCEAQLAELRARDSLHEDDIRSLTHQLRQQNRHLQDAFDRLPQEQ